MKQIKIQYSNGRGKSGRQYAYIRPAGKCFNRSRRVKSEDVEKAIAKHFPEVYYFRVDGFVIGARNEEYALKEYWRVCEKEKIGKIFPAEKITANA